jgi:hypothetical protein
MAKAPTSQGISCREALTTVLMVRNNAAIFRRASIASAE